MGRDSMRRMRLAPATLSTVGDFILPKDKKGLSEGGDSFGSVLSDGRSGVGVA
jgi:hypothetical protein